MRHIYWWTILVLWGCSSGSGAVTQASQGGSQTGIGGQANTTGGVTPGVGGTLGSATSDRGGASFGGVAASGVGGNGASSSVGGAAQGTGGAVSTGGAGAVGGNSSSGGALAGGATSKGGASTGGASATGGAVSLGGATSKGGASATGGAVSLGGATSKGGASATGGAVSLGGASATGGAVSLGGATSKGGTTNTATPLSSFARTLGPSKLSGISDNASGVAWKTETDTFFVVSNGTHALYEYTADFKTLLRTVTLTNGGTDTEDVVYLGSNRFAVVTEENDAYVVTVSDGATSASMSAADVEHYVVSAPPATTNRGFEGITFRPGAGTAGQFIVCQEGGVSGTPIRVLFFDRHTSGGSFSYTDSTLVVQEPWNALTKLGSVATDLAAVCFDAASSTLLVLSQESSRLLRVAPETGAILEQRDLSGSPQYEGVTVASGGRLVLISEPNWVEVYQAD